MVLEGCGAAGQQAVGIMLRPLIVNLLALLLIPKEYISSRGRGLSVPLSGPPTFVRRRGTLCMVPSPLCGRLVTFINFISKTRIKNYNFQKMVETDANVALLSRPDIKTKVLFDCISNSIIEANTFLKCSCAPLGCFTHALMFAGGFTGTGFTEPMRTCAKGAAERFVSSTYVRLHAYGTRKGGIIFDMASIWKYLKEGWCSRAVGLQASRL